MLGAIFFLPICNTTLARWTRRGCIDTPSAFSNQRLLVTSALFPLILPATIPLWQVALGILFGVVIGKEIFGGVGMNILNPALTGRAFLFFAYPAQISGDKPWLPFSYSSDVAVGSLPEASSGATYLALMANPTWVSEKVDAYQTTFALGGEKWMNAFLGMVPGSMGETSALACLIGAVF